MLDSYEFKDNIIYKIEHWIKIIKLKGINDSLNKKILILNFFHFSVIFYKKILINITFFIYYFFTLKLKYFQFLKNVIKFLINIVKLIVFKISWADMNDMK